MGPYSEQFLYLRQKPPMEPRLGVYAQFILIIRNNILIVALGATSGGDANHQ